jgi:glycosyltransferase involved in cell wall biosynthesis
MKIYINARFLTQEITGVQRYAHELTRALDVLADSGEINGSEFRFELLSPMRGILHQPELKHFHLRRVGRLSGHAWEQFELPFYSRNGLLFCPGNTAPVLSLMLGKPVVVTVHDLSYLYFPEAYSVPFRLFYRTVMPLVLGRAGEVITVSQAEGKSILDRYPKAEGRLHPIQSGASFFCDEEDVGHLPSDPAEPFVLYVGSLNKRKNLLGFVRAMGIVNRENDVNVVVVGSTARSFKRLRFDLPKNITGKVSFMGQIDERELMRLYKTAVCLVFPSFYEASGLPPLEAMACGCNVIASSIPSLLERCGDAALYCNPNSPEDIAEKTALLLGDDALREELRQKGLERSRLFTWENCARETFKVLKKAAEKKKMH